MSDALIHLGDVGKTFERRGNGSRVEALRGVRLDVAPGEFVSLLGPSGCGKSTLLRIIGGLVDASRGTVEVDGVTPHRARHAKRFGLVPQTPALLPWRTVADNVRLLAEVNTRGASQPPLPRDDVDTLLETVGLGGFTNAYPNELSGGMQQRVSLVRAFALGAPILLMDEPFASLDEITRADMRYLLLDLWERAGGRTTVVFVTHSVAEAVTLADRVVVLAARPGRIVRIEPINLGRPRVEALEDTPAFHEHVANLRHALREGHAA